MSVGLPDPAVGRNKAIDGWRAVAVCCVIFAHMVNYRFVGIDAAPIRWAKWLSKGLAEIGVQLFFVISGYIITLLLRRERETTNSVSITAFYIRRTCRILPPLFAYYLCVWLLSATGYIALPLTSLLTSASFTCNVGINDCHWWVSHTWSLAVEEQFYIFWPILFSLLAWRLQHRILVCLVILLMVGEAFRGQMWHSNFTSFGCIAIGAAYASSQRMRELLVKAAHPLPWLCALGVVLLFSAYPVVRVLMPLLILYVLFSGITFSFVRAILESRPFQLVGALSYSLYLWQQLFLAKPVLYAGSPPNLILLLIPVGLSYFFLEKFFIRIGHKCSKAAKGRQLMKQASASAIK